MDLRKYIKYALPHIVVETLRHDPQNIEKSKYLTDLTVREMYALLAVLMELEREVNDPSYLEIGIFKGGTLKFLKNHTKHTTFTGIDYFEDFVPEDGNTHVCETFPVKTVMDYVGRDRVTLIKGDSAQVLPELKKSQTHFDMIFIDGNHKYGAVKRDFDNSLEIIKKGWIHCLS
ncbi:class I SAM-dependent methyltransferase [Candidatus Magnetominusculus xianensis]|uniref:Class I SAM-dependent methyltransferase n=1 Tax=Candidatus Magnetominusculus xianensis TaxID=1748249 RepID=A0ABR5SGU7_9BACT|nr:class I SAM-dependent methyltransferase [Candidatus Magnetominusculus xianensis]KWT82526.1 hypothetical protein ASN18_2468 [Candidatus Magnetominusculus xianensis]MBF0405523.1 class I SAM-dependent methyltransferase [Nitrospirota bacterium]